ncbi:hypothetical protein JVU11DRAFT_7890 [Chiua virens]|nr:hypothetical protein JVU11DRAFT_7890 [Chiua virens]
MNADDKEDMAVQSETRGTQRKTFPQKMTAISARLTRALSTTEGGDSSSVAETLVDKRQDTPSDIESRSVSRGREAFVSRLVLDMVRAHTACRYLPEEAGRVTSGVPPCPATARPIDGPDDFSPTRGREPAVHPERILSTGRGGAGNIRSPSKDPHIPPIPEGESTYQAKLIHDHAETTILHSSGRGGVGNISASRSRSRDPATVMHSTGRGGAGNIHPGSHLRPDSLDQEERIQHTHHEGIHSTGRGGAANITVAHEPDVEHVHHHHHLGELESTGRGGAGNIIRDRSASRDPGTRADSKEKHGIAAIFDKMTH